MAESKPEELALGNGLTSEMLIEVGREHRLAAPEPLAKMLEACERLDNKTQNESNR